MLTLERAVAMGAKFFSVLGIFMGQYRLLANLLIHFSVDDMQLNARHMLMQSLYANRPKLFDYST